MKPDVKNLTARKAPKAEQGANVCRRLLPALIAGCFACAPAWANPSGAQIVSGQVNISNSGNVLTVTNSPGSIINWQSFSIGAGQLTQFLQQSASSAVLNRIVGQDPSQIFGALQSNGKVYLINPNGILFGGGAQVKVGGLVASSLDISNADFSAGKLNFNPSATITAAGAVTNQGSISTPAGGSIYLIAPQVQNTGIITSPQGEVLLAAGHSVQLVDGGDPNLQVVISAPADQALNLGQVVAQGGKIGIYGALVNQNGIVNADSAVVGQNGEIVFKSSQTTMLAGNSVTSAQGAGSGGTIYLEGPQVGLTDTAQVNASGQNGGGTVLVGGGFHGANAAIENANAVYVGAGTLIEADAIQNGNGGNVAVWSQDATRFYGSISAHGGTLGGNGGFVETSGEKYLDFEGAVKLTAPNGAVGTLLLDPDDVMIDNSAGTPISGISGSASLFSDSGTGGALSYLNVNTLNGQLNLGNVTVSTSTGSITVAAPIVTVPVPSTTLTFNSGNLITFNAGGSISAGGSNPLNVSMTAANGINTSAGAINTNGGSAIMSTSAGNLVTGGISVGTSTINLNASEGSVTGGTLSGANLFVNATTGISLITNGGSFDLTNALSSGSGDIVLNNSSTPITSLFAKNYNGNVTVNTGGSMTFRVDTGPNLVATGNVSANAAGAIVIPGATGIQAGGNVSVISQSSLDLGGSSSGGYGQITAGGTSVLLQAGTGGPNALTINGYATVSAPSATLTLNAGGAISITTPGNLSYNAFFSNPGLYSPIIDIYVTGQTVNNLTYNGSNVATLANGQLSGVPAADLSGVSLGPQTGTFAQTGVGKGIAVTANDTLTGPLAADFILIQPLGLTGNINPALLSVTGQIAANKIYDGTTVATLLGGTLKGVLPSDTANVALNQAGYFASSNVGNGVSVIAADSLSGSGASNYNLIEPVGLTANIVGATVVTQATPAILASNSYIVALNTQSSTLLNPGTSIPGSEGSSGASNSGATSSGTNNPGGNNVPKKLYCN